jgi:hypothetical protein
MNDRFRVLYPLLLVFLLATLCAAQSNASIEGTVTDGTGAVISGAQVTVKNSAVGLQRTATTDDSGVFRFPSLPLGEYSIEATASGFQKQVIKGVLLEVGTHSVQALKLSVGNNSEVVEVSSEPPLIESTTPTVGQTISERTVQEIPLNGRHFVDLGLLIPGSVTPPQNGFLTAPLRGQGSFAFNTAGQREDTVNFMVNGVNLNDPVQNQITFQPSINTVSEFKVDNSTYSAEYGRSSGAIVNIATRSGTNDYHGEVFEFIRNNALDARNYFNPRTQPQSSFKRNQFGAAFGGPIVKDKTFFFLSYEGLRQRQGLTLNQQVLTTAQRAGVTDPVSKKLLDLIPTANDPTGTLFQGSAVAPVDIDQGTADISHSFSDKDRIHGYYAFQRDLRIEPTLQGNNIPGFGDTRSSHRQIMTINETHTFSPALLNDFRLGFNRINITFAPNGTQDPSTFGIQDGKTGAVGLPQITIGGLGLNFGGPTGFPQGRGDTTAVFADSVNYLKGRHNWKFGTEVRRIYNNNFTQDTGSLGFLNVAGFQAGTPNAFAITLGSAPSRISSGALGFFVQDNFRLRTGLTLEFGLRWDWFMTPNEARARFVNFDPNTDRLSQVQEPYKNNVQNIQPRVGFAWDVFSDGKTIVRSGFGILADQPITNLVSALTSNFPLANPQSFVSTGPKPTTTYANLLADAKGSGLAPTAVDRNFENGSVYSYNLNIQQQLGSKTAVMIGYFGSKGTNLRTRVNANQFVSGTTRPFPTLSSDSPIAPGATLGNISQNRSLGNSTYNGLWLTANARGFHGLSLNGSYTFSKSIDYTSQNGQGIVIQNSLNPAGDRGLSDFDARHRIVANAIYDLPFKGNRLKEGWEVTTITQWQTGNPVNILANAASIAGLTGVASIRPDLIGPIQYLRAPQVVNNVPTGNIQWFQPFVCNPTSAAGCPSGNTFAIPANTASTYHFGNLGRNVVIGPGFTNVDFSLIKTTKITERVKTQFRAEMFDIFNHPNFGQPGRTAQVGSTTFGVITNTRFPVGDSGSARQIQFALKLMF